MPRCRVLARRRLKTSPKPHRSNMLLEQSGGGSARRACRGASQFNHFSVVSTIVLSEPSGAACIPGGVCPCGLEAGAPPVPVSRGPVRP
jgi:hypothetical protein